MTNYLHMPFLGNDHFEVDVEYEVIDGDDSVGLAKDYEFTVTVIDEDDNEIDITDDLTRKEIWEVIEAIQKDISKSEYDND